MVVVNPYCKCGHLSRVHRESVGSCQQPVSGGGPSATCDCKLFHNEQNPLLEPLPIPEESGLVKHARSELALIENDEKFKDGLIDIVRIFSAQRHSGSSAEVAIELIGRLLRREPLTPLTDHPDEWHYVGHEQWDGTNGIWQNKRDSRAFSLNGGRTYWLVTDKTHREMSATQTPEGAIEYRKRYRDLLAEDN